MFATKSTFGLCIACLAFLLLPAAGAHRAFFVDASPFVGNSVDPLAVARRHLDLANNLLGPSVGFPYPFQRMNAFRFHPNELVPTCEPAETPLESPQSQRKSNKKKRNRRALSGSTEANASRDPHSDDHKNAGGRQRDSLRHINTAGAKTPPNPCSHSRPDISVPCNFNFHALCRAEAEGESKAAL
mmetsp:Transcript_15944/g.38646  ORF Transcript_15944/g.38646 Transcript_15944/m.38646 type:complete len:186 (+) Transcript_15944:89-646(+)